MNISVWCLFASSRLTGLIWLRRRYPRRSNHTSNLTWTQATLARSSPTCHLPAHLELHLSMRRKCSGATRSWRHLCCLVTTATAVHQLDLPIVSQQIPTFFLLSYARWASPTVYMIKQKAKGILKETYWEYGTRNNESVRIEWYVNVRACFSGFVFLPKLWIETGWENVGRWNVFCMPEVYWAADRQDVRSEDR